MKKEIENIAEASFLNKILKFSAVQETDQMIDTLLEKGLSVFEAIPEFISVSFFLLDVENSRFTFSQSRGNISENEAQILYEQLLEKEIIAHSLSDGSADYLPNEGNKKVLVFPLNTTTGVEGIIILTLDLSFSSEELVDLMKLHTNNFALKFSNTLNVEELRDMKDSYIKKVSDYTEEIAQSSRGLRSILDAIQTGLILFEKNSGKIVDVNSYTISLIGLSKELLIGTGRNNYFILSDYRNAQGHIVKGGEMFFRKNDGSIIQVLSRLIEIMIGQEEFIVESFIDITDRKKMENVLLKAHDEMEERVARRTKDLSAMNIELQKQIQEKAKTEAEKIKLYYAVHQSPAIIIITDLKGTIEYINPIFTTTTGYELNEVVGKNPRFLKSGDIADQEYQNLWSTINNGDYWRGEFRNKKKNGELFWVSSFVSPIKNSKGEIINYLAIQQDITDKKIVEQNLIEAKERAEESDRLKSNILANMSHEFRTPLIGIIGFTQILQDEVGNEEHSFYLDQISECNDRLMNTLSNVLSFTQLQSMDVNAPSEKIALGMLLENISLKYFQHARLKKLHLDYTPEPCLQKIMVDKQLCTQMISNVVDNAVKFSNEGMVSISGLCFEMDSKNYVTIQVKDTGVGISEEMREKIFEPFRQESEGYSRTFEGLGLGLSITKKIIDLMNGTITVENNLPAGAIFTLTFPVIAAELSSDTIND